MATATTAIPTVLATTTRVPPTRSTATPNKTYLNKCIEDLSPKKLAECKSEATKWNRLSIVTTVAFFALAIGATIAVGLLAPAFTSLVALSAILLAIPAASKVVKFHARYNEAQSQFKNYVALQRHHEDLIRPTQTPAELQSTLVDLEIPQIPGQDLTRLIPLIAKAKYFKEKEAYFTNQKNQALNAARAIPGKTEGQKLEQAIKHHLALEFEDLALLYKLKNAFVNAVLRNPEFRGNLDDVGTLSTSAMNPGTRLDAIQLKVPNADHMFTFKNRNNVAPITYNEVETTTSVAQLGSRMLAAMRT
jgi:hypothetical protein